MDHDSRRTRRDYGSKSRGNEEGRRSRSSKDQQSRSRSRNTKPESLKSSTRTSETESTGDQGKPEDMIEKFIEDQLRQLRKDTSTAPIEFRVETYVSQGMSESDAIIYINPRVAETETEKYSIKELS